MRTIHADFSTRTEDQAISISLSATRQLCIRSGDRIRLTDGTMEVEAEIEYRTDGAVALPQWSTLTYID